MLVTVGKVRDLMGSRLAIQQKGLLEIVLKARHGCNLDEDGFFCNSRLVIGISVI